MHDARVAERGGRDGRSATAIEYGPVAAPTACVIITRAPLGGGDPGKTSTAAATRIGATVQAAVGV